MSDAAGHDPSRALLGTMRLTGRTGVDAVDGPCGTVADIVVDPQHRRVTHLVVRPGGRHHAPRLVPIEAVTAFAERVTLSWTRAELDAAAPVPHASLLAFGDWPVQTDGRWDPGVAPPFSWTYFGQAGPAALLTQAGLGRLAPFAPRSVDRIPSGTAEVRHASEVVSSDGRIVGHVGGLGPGAPARHPRGAGGTPLAAGAAARRRARRNASSTAPPAPRTLQKLITRYSSTALSAWMARTFVVVSVAVMNDSTRPSPPGRNGSCSAAWPAGWAWSSRS